MIRIRQLKVPVGEDDLLLDKICHKLKISKDQLINYSISRKSIDARDKKNIFTVFEVDVECRGEETILRRVSSSDIFLLEEVPYSFPKTGTVLLKERPIIIGSGPCGLFCAYFLSKNGFSPIILERGEKIEDRVKTVQDLFDKNIFNEDSNIQFGEGGAGTFSDGKLHTMIKDSFGRGKKVLEIFVENGAPSEILYEQHPHIGTDILRNVIINMRNRIISWGGEFHYSSCVTDFLFQGDSIVGVEVNHHDIYSSSVVVLAIGHSARDTFYCLHNHSVSMKPKNFAVGFRIEHPRKMIDESQYGEFSKVLGSAPYKLTYQTKSGRGVYSFCMCPGGYIVNSSSEKGRICCNGMSYYNRDGNGSNSAIVVSVTPKDFGDGLFAGVEFQRKIEEAAYQEGKGMLPVQLYQDFVENQISTSFGEFTPNIKGSYSFGNLNHVLPSFLCDSIKEAIPVFGKRIKGFDRWDAVLVGVEARTSSPVVILRDEKYQSTYHGLYPCGEGAGYAGGITTAAIDGIKVAEEIAKTYYVK